MTIRIIPYDEHYLDALVDLCYQSILAVDETLYPRQQKLAWAAAFSEGDQRRPWLDRLKPFLLLVDDRLAACMALEADGHIECAYTHPGQQRRGLGAALLAHVEDEALRRNIECLYVEASLAAKPLFERYGFELIGENRVHRAGQALLNVRMEKSLVDLDE